MRARLARGWLAAAALGVMACSADPSPSPFPKDSPDASAGGSGGSSNGGSSNGGRASGGSNSGGSNSGGRASGGSNSGGSNTGGSAAGGETQSGGASNGGSGTGGSNTGGSNTGGQAQGSGGSEPTCACSSGHCLEDGGCVECLTTPSDTCESGKFCDADHTCKTGCKTSAECGIGVCTAGHSCTECNPANDQCATGKYCSADGACLAGCKANGGGCASGACTASHECTSCIADDECALGRVCSSGTCMGHCGQDDECTGSLTCCGTRCADTTRDFRFCHACGVTCAAGEFCGKATCRTATVANVCDSAKATVLLDGLDVDEALAPAITATMTNACGASLAIRTAKQGEANTINKDTGQPFVGSGDLQVVVGGPYGQYLLRYLEQTGATSIYNSADTTAARFNLRGADGGPGAPVVDAPQASITASHSFFLIEAVADPSTGTLMFAIDGFNSEGTVAGVYYFGNVMVPALASQTKSFYVYEWTNADADPAGSAGDTYTLVTSGP